MATVLSRAAGVVVALALLPSASAADEPPVVAAGMRVRVWERLAEPRPITGAVRALDERAIVLQPREGSASAVSVPLAVVERVQVSVGRRSRARRGALLGVGTFWGLVLLTVLDSGLAESGVASPQAAIGTLACAGLGALVGSVFATDEWKDARLPSRPDGEPRPTGARSPSPAPVPTGPTAPSRPAVARPGEGVHAEG